MDFHQLCSSSVPSSFILSPRMRRHRKPQEPGRGVRREKSEPEAWGASVLFLGILRSRLTPHLLRQPVRMLLSTLGVCLYGSNVPVLILFVILHAFSLRNLLVTLLCRYSNLPMSPPPPLQNMGFEISTSFRACQSSASEKGSSPLEEASIWTNYAESGASRAIFGSHSSLLTHSESTRSLRL